ncbi:MAG: hypothetical protein WC471_04740 [Candidatus Woesearchaeota archaeon]
MKRLSILTIVFILSVSMVFAAANGAGVQQGAASSSTVDSSVTAGSDSEPAGSALQTSTETTTQNQGADSQVQAQQQTQTDNPGIGEQVKILAQTQTKLQSGNYAAENGKQLQVLEQVNNKLQLKSGIATAETSMEMTQEKTQTGTKLQVKLSNGKNAEVKIMPDTASETALARLRLKTCVSEEGCTIELKEVGEGDQVRAAYEVQAEKEAKLLGLFKTKMQVQAQVDAENGEVITSHKPWWAFLATESE